MIKVKNLKKNFGGVRAVNGCSFEVQESKITALIGPNGSGKSTAFNLIAGISKPDEGQIFFGGENIAGKSVDAISNLGISRVFQQSRLFRNLTVKENLLVALNSKDSDFWRNLFGLNKTTEEQENKATDMLELLTIKHIENRIAGNLSFGQKRLVELGRAILNPHKFLMLDEPVAGVSPFVRKEIKKILLDLRKRGETIFLIEHDMLFTFDIADDVIVLDEGRVIARGSPQKIRDDPNVAEAYFG